MEENIKFKFSAAERKSKMHLKAITSDSISFHVPGNISFSLSRHQF